jgi:osmotically-inducible protein OsmY
MFSAAQKSKAEQVARDVEGVKDVNNLLVVDQL